MKQGHSSLLVLGCFSFAGTGDLSRVQCTISRENHFAYILTNNAHPQRRQRVRSYEVISTAERNVEEEQLEVCPSTLWKILRKDLDLKAYKIQLVQELEPCSYHVHRTSGELTENQVDFDPHLQYRILFSGEVHF
ncbi:hypothetical protein Trydic_g21486 [Trypoxylus dichotomus]